MQGGPAGTSHVWFDERDGTRGNTTCPSSPLLVGLKAGFTPPIEQKSKSQYQSTFSPT
jgi:hypothetical protein